jgi:hypothetical protein
MSVPGSSTPPWVKWWPSIAGFAVVVLLIVGSSLPIDGTPDFSDSDQEWIDWFADSGHVTQGVIATFLYALAALALLLFVVHLADWVRGAATGYDPVSTIVLVAGALFSLCVLIGAVGINQVALTDTFAGEIEIQSADVLKLSQTMGYGTFLIGAFFAALMIAIVSAAAQRRGLMPKWLVIAGYIVAIALLFAAFFLPMILFVLWVLAISILWLRQPQTT